MKKKTLGTTIAELRKKQGMTQLDLANRMNVTDKAVSKWERDLSCPDVSSLPRLAETLNVTVDELMHCKAPDTSSATQESPRSVAELALVCVALAMGVAVVALTAMGKAGAMEPMDSQDSVTMLAAGVACLGAWALLKKN